MTMITNTGSQLSERVHGFVRRGFSPQFDMRAEEFRSEPIWQQFCDLGTELWLDSGDLDKIGEMWTREFSALR